MNRKLRFANIILIIALLIAAYLFSGCNGSSDIIVPPHNNLYSISGAVVKDLNTDVISDSTRIALKLRLDNNPANNADINFFNQTLTYSLIDNSTDLAYVFPPANNQTLLAAGNYDLSIMDSTLIDDMISVIIIDTIRITAYNPDSTTVNLNGQLNTIEWTSALNVSGYVVAVTPADSAYSGYGYVGYVATQTTQYTIPRDAFRTPTGNNDLVTGLYHLYVYAYNGAPDSSLSSSLLPVPLPSQLPDNINKTNLKGNFGTVVVTKRVPIMVVAG